VPVRLTAAPNPIVAGFALVGGLFGLVFTDGSVETLSEDDPSLYWVAVTFLAGAALLLPWLLRPVRLTVTPEALTVRFPYRLRTTTIPWDTVTGITVLTLPGPVLTPCPVLTLDLSRPPTPAATITMARLLHQQVPVLLQREKGRPGLAFRCWRRNPELHELLTALSTFTDTPCDDHRTAAELSGRAADSPAGSPYRQARAAATINGSAGALLTLVPIAVEHWPADTAPFLAVAATVGALTTLVLRTTDNPRGAKLAATVSGLLACALLVALVNRL
jgi:hypothetical protein